MWKAVASIADAGEDGEVLPGKDMFHQTVASNNCLYFTNKY